MVTLTVYVPVNVRPIAIIAGFQFNVSEAVLTTQFELFALGSSNGINRSSVTFRWDWWVVTVSVLAFSGGVSVGARRGPHKIKQVPYFSIRESVVCGGSNRVTLFDREATSVLGSYFWFVVLSSWEFVSECGWEYVVDVFPGELVEEFVVLFGESDVAAAHGCSPDIGSGVPWTVISMAIVCWPFSLIV